MYILGYFLQAVAFVLGALIQVAIIAVVVRAVLSFVSPDPYNPLVRLIYQLTDPMLRPVQRLLPPWNGMDFSPLVVLMGLYFLDIFLVQTLNRFAHSLL